MPVQSSSKAKAPRLVLRFALYAALTLAGKPVLDVTNLNHEGGQGRDVKVLETYVPVRFGGRNAVGVFELYQDYGPVAAATRAAFVPVAGGSLSSSWSSMRR